MHVYSQSNYKYVSGTGGNAIVLKAGQTVVVTVVPTTKHGRIHRLIVKQASGASTAFKVNLYDDDITRADTFGTDISRIIAEQTVTSGVTCFVNAEVGYPFRNKRNLAEVYLVISVTAAPASDLYFDASITWATPET